MTCALIGTKGKEVDIMTHAKDVAKFLALKAIWEHKTKTAKIAFDHAESVAADFSAPLEENGRRLDAAIRAARRAIQNRESAKNNLVAFLKHCAKSRGLMSTTELRLYLGDENIF